MSIGMTGKNQTGLICGLIRSLNHRTSQWAKRAGSEAEPPDSMVRIPTFI